MKTMSRNNKGRGRRTEEGLTLIETLVAMVILLVVMAGLAPLLVIGVRADDANQRQVEVLNVARDKLEVIQTIPYEQVGIMPGGGGTSGGGYFETDPIINPTYNAATDIDLSEAVALTFGTQATVTVTVDAIDHAADLTGTDDWDEVRDPNTGSVLDYKVVTVVVTATDPVSGLPLRNEATTIIRGVLDAEIDGATGEDGGAGAPPPPPKDKGKKDKDKKDKKDKKKKDKDQKDKDEGKDQGKGKGRKGKSDETPE